MATVTLRDRTDTDQRQILDALLSEGRDERAKEKAARSVSLAALLGEYEPVAGHGHYWARAPKLRQQIEIARISDQQAKITEDSGAANIEGAAKMAQLAVFVEENGKMRQATLDEVLDEFDASEVATILQKYLGFGATGGSDPNATA